MDYHWHTQSIIILGLIELGRNGDGFKIFQNTCMGFLILHKNMMIFVNGFFWNSRSLKRVNSAINFDFIAGVRCFAVVKVCRH